MTRYRILSWREIPAQVKAWSEDGRAHSVLLPDWFQQEIDRVAMREGLTDSDAYLEHWNWSEDMEQEGPAPEVAARVADELTAAWQDKGDG